MKFEKLQRAKRYPVWVHMCLSRCSFLLNDLLHESSLHLNGRSPMCDFKCCIKNSFFLNPFWQTSQVVRLISWIRLGQPWVTFLMECDDNWCSWMVAISDWSLGVSSHFVMFVVELVGGIVLDELLEDTLVLVTIFAEITGLFLFWDWADLPGCWRKLFGVPVIVIVAFCCWVWDSCDTCMTGAETVGSSLLIESFW